MGREQMNIVIVGHVDHGKSTVIGRLLADSDSLPEGKLEAVKENCRRNAKPFEYAFLLDALKDEQAQGITIDSARCFFNTEKRDYIVIDAPGHIEFLKNMISGAARAEAALLVIDAKEGIQENSKRHCYLLSMLGIKQVSVLVNKMDLVDYSQERFENIKEEYTAFLTELKVEPTSFIPISAFEGDNIVTSSPKMPWFKGYDVLSQLDGFSKAASTEHQPFRFPVQGVYKFTKKNDDRRIIAGTIETGTIKTGDEVIFLPSMKKTKIKSIEGFNTPSRNVAVSGEATGFTMETQIYIQAGELMVKAKEEQPKHSTQFKANIFWMGKAPFVKNKSYKLKIHARRASVKLISIERVLDASQLDSNLAKDRVDRHDVGECILETAKPLSYDLANEIEQTGRFVLIDNYEIVGGGIILDDLKSEDSTLAKHVKNRAQNWHFGHISKELRASKYGHPSQFILITGEDLNKNEEIAKILEQELFEKNTKAYFTSINNLKSSLQSEEQWTVIDRNEETRRLGEVATILLDSGQVVISAMGMIDDYDINRLQTLVGNCTIQVFHIGENSYSQFQSKRVFTFDSSNKEITSQILKEL